MRLIDRSSAAAAGPHRARTHRGTGGRDLASLSNHLAKDLITAGGQRSPRWSRAVLVAELAGIALLVSASTAHADTVVLALASSVTDILSNIQKWIMGILAGLATLFLTIGAIRYVWGGGDPGEVAKAKTAFKSAGFGYCLALLAPLVLEILKGFVGAP